jgi:hypothetical protein
VAQKVPSIARVAAEAFGFLTFNHAFDGPDLYGASSFFETMPSRPSLQIALNISAPSPLECAFCAFRWAPIARTERRESARPFARMFPNVIGSNVFWCSWPRRLFISAAQKTGATKTKRSKNDSATHDFFYKLHGLLVSSPQELLCHPHVAFMLRGVFGTRCKTFSQWTARLGRLGPAR